MYNREKKNPYGRSDRDLSEGQNGTPKDTAKKIAEKTGVSDRTVKRIAKKLKQLKATQRETAKALGVGVATVNRDIKDEAVPNGTNGEGNPALNETDGDNNNDSVPNGTNDSDPLFSEDPKKINEELKKAARLRAAPEDAPAKTPVGGKAGKQASSSKIKV